MNLETWLDFQPVVYPPVVADDHIAHYCLSFSTCERKSYQGDMHERKCEWIKFIKSVWKIDHKKKKSKKVKSIINDWYYKLTELSPTSSDLVGT